MGVGEDAGVQARFVLGPAGSGKTHRCLEEIRAELRNSASVLPLVLLAPKQATFQLERQLLGGGGLEGFSRLMIVSFERLAEFIIEEFAGKAVGMLGEDGRLMVLRALLARHHGELRLFRATARLPGFAAQLSGLLRDFQRHRLSPGRLGEVGAGVGGVLGDKLHDFALILRAYEGWLRGQGLRDGSEVLEVATDLLRELGGRGGIRWGGVWLDGFAELTPQEVELLGVLLPLCERATVAFCLEGRPVEEPGWLSTWSVVAQTFRRCHARVAAEVGCEVVVEELGRVAERGRFAGCPVLGHLERGWAGGRVYGSGGEGAAAGVGGELAVYECGNPEGEVVLAAREILGWVRRGGRYRDCAVLVRQMRGYDRVIRRVFTRYEIPYFLDQREAVAHHPLAELTRFGLRVVAFGWRREDWFGALKTGLAGVEEREIDWLENEALEHGWEGGRWREPLVVPGREESSARAEGLRLRLVPAFVRLGERLGERATGRVLAGALREFWEGLGVGRELERWSVARVAHPKFQIDEAIHRTVWGQMGEWVDNVELAFGEEAMGTREWLPVLESGLGGLSVGVIPPALDQVLVGTVDRSRNPELKVALVLGLNESVFPAPPPAGVLLTEEERLVLEGREVYLGPSARQRLGQERYFGYIACTRSSGRLVLTRALADGEGKPLNPSPFLAQVGRMFPGLVVERVGGWDWREAEHGCELMGVLRELDGGVEGGGEGEKVGGGEGGTVGWREIAGLEVFREFLERARGLRGVLADAPLAGELVEGLLGRELAVSVSRLEDFAACPFKFFVGRTLRGEERKEFEVDERLAGEFRHEVMSRFHRRLAAGGKRWRDVSPEVAAGMVREIGEGLLPEFHEGVMRAHARSEFAARGVIEGLTKLAAVLVEWMGQYEFDPVAVELSFGMEEGGLPAWRLELGEERALVLRGRIDRVDVAREGGGADWVVIIDYKSKKRNFDALHLEHGLDLQLPAYLNALLRGADGGLGGSGLAEVLGVAGVRAAGLFYVALRGSGGAGATREEVLAGVAGARRELFQHQGRFDRSAVGRLDNRPGRVKGDQFRFKLKRDGGFDARGCDGLTAEDFAELLAENVRHLAAHGRGIFAGEIGVRPYRAGKETACDSCKYRAICRFDSWTDAYRVLRAGSGG